MFKRTRKELLELWSYLTILKDPAPFPLDGETTLHLKKAGKALIKDIYDLINDKASIINHLNYKKL